MPYYPGEVRTWTTRQDDKREWGPGPWDHEPDKIHWISPTTDLDCLMVRGPLGAWCGYVGVPEEHPWHGLSYWTEEGVSPDSLVRVHGGLTYAAPCQEQEDGICHVSEPGRPDNVWWFGFDCCHSGDLIPSTVRHRRRYGWEEPPYAEEYRGLEYVGAETESLARQVSQLAYKSE